MRAQLIKRLIQRQGRSLPRHARAACAAPLLILSALSGCISPIEVTGDMYVEAAAGAAGAASAPTGGGAGAQVTPLAGTGSVAGSAPPVAGFTSPDTPCTPGERPSRCVICDAAGMLSTPQSDISCPDLDCAARSSYRQVGYPDGKVECRRQRFTPRYPSQCQGFGACYARAEYCKGETEETTIDAVSLSECLSIEGCEGEVEGTLLTREGEPCGGGQGVCDGSGACVMGGGGAQMTAMDSGPSPDPSMPRTCDSAFQPTLSQLNAQQTYLCPPPNPQDPLLCNVHLDKRTNNDQNYRCGDFCTQHNATCVDAWNDNDTNRCSYNGDHDCGSDGLGSFICQCRLN